MCESNLSLAGFICFVGFIVFSIIGAFLIGTGWALGNSKNAKLVGTTCSTQRYTVDTAQCSVACCSTDSKGNCLSCLRTCFKGIVFVGIAAVADGARLEIGSTFVSAVSILADMTIAYPVNGTFTCYYDRTTAIPGVATAGVAVQLAPTDTSGFFIGAMVMFAFAGVFLLVLLVALVVVLIVLMADCIRDAIAERARVKERNARIEASELAVVAEEPPTAPPMDEVIDKNQ